MRNPRMIALLLIASAIILFVFFVKYETRPVRHASGSYDVIARYPDEIVSLGLADSEPAPGSWTARYHGQIAGERALFARAGSPLIAGIAGLLLPAICMGLALAKLINSAKKA